jgi:hypothetical protein
MTEEKRINLIIEENKSGLQQEEANANQSIMMLSDIIRYSKTNNSEVENDYDLDVDAKGTIVLLAELWRIQDIIHNCSRSLRRRYDRCLVNKDVHIVQSE